MNNYTKVSNQVLEDATLSLKAKGLFAYLVKLPEGWKIRIGEIAKHHKDGYDSVQSALNELRSAGYLERLGRSRDKGKVGDWEYRINAGLAPDRGKPVQENPVQVEPDKENPVQVDSPPAQVESAIAPDRENPNATPPDREKPDKEIPCVYIKDLERKKEKINKKEKVAVARSSRRQIEYTTAFESFWKLYRDHCYPTAGDKERAFHAFQRCLQEQLTADQIEQSAVNYCLAQRERNLDTRHAERFLKQADFVRDFLEAKPLQSEAATPQRYQSADEKNRSVLDAFLKGDANGKQGNDSPSADRVFSQHRKDDTKRVALSLVAAVQRRTG